MELVSRGLIPSREKAKVAVLAGKVRVNGQKAAKPSDWIYPEDQLSLSEPEKFVSRGGFKLEHAIRSFGITLSESSVALDIGASRRLYRLPPPGGCRQSLRHRRGPGAIGLEAPAG